MTESRKFDEGLLACFTHASNGGQSILPGVQTGRATVALLRMNNDLIMDLRRLWVILGLHPRDMEL